MDTLDAPTSQGSQQRTSSYPGYYGKLPQRGDFITYGLNNGFVKQWDAWISEGLDASKRSLGDAWLNRFLHAPIWRFYIAKGVINDTANIGIWFASMDKVGRYFPFTICCQIEEAPSGWLGNESVNEFFKRLERIGMVALDEACGVEDVDEALEDTPWPIKENSPYKKWQGDLNLKSTCNESLSGLNGLLFDVVRNDHPRLSLWWSIQENGKTRYQLHDGLPQARNFIDFL